MSGVVPERVHTVGVYVVPGVVCSRERNIKNIVQRQVCLADTKIPVTQVYFKPIYRVRPFARRSAFSQSRHWRRVLQRYRNTRKLSVANRRCCILPQQESVNVLVSALATSGVFGCFRLLAPLPLGVEQDKATRRRN